MQRPFAQSLILISPLLLGGCVAGPAPEIATPAPELPQEFHYGLDAPTISSLASLIPNEDPAYRSLSQAAVADAPSLAEALARVEAARAGARRSGAERLPNISANGAVTGTRTNPNQFGSGSSFSQFIDTEQISYGANIVASWDTDIFGRLKAQERAALARLDAATSTANAVRNSLIAEIAGSVIDWRTLEARTEALDQDVAAANTLAALAKTREDAGIAPGFDRVRAEAAASASLSRRAALQSERARIVGRLVTLTGTDADQVVAALSQTGNLPRLGPPPAALPSLLLTNRPDVVAAASDLAATDAELAAAARARFPRLTLSGVLGLLAFDPGDLFKEDSLVGTLAAGLAGPLLDFGRIEAEIDGAAANKKAAFAAYRGAVFHALGDAEAAYGLIAAADTQAALAVKERDELDRAARLADTRYRAGLANFLTVLEARRAADASGERAATALGQTQRARVVLWQALGGEPVVETSG